MIDKDGELSRLSHNLKLASYQRLQILQFVFNVHV